MGPPLSAQGTPGTPTVSDGTAVWAWTAVRIEAAADLTESREYAELPEEERRTKVIAAEMAWLAGQWNTADDARIYADVARRYTDRAFRIRVALASPQPLSEGLAELAGATFSPAERPGHGTVPTGLFVGTTGSGKTNTTLAFCEQLWRDHRIPFLVIDPVNSDLDDYRWLATRPGFEALVVLTVGDETIAPLRLNPFEVPLGVRISTHIAGALACFDAAFGLWDPLPSIYNRALRNTYARKGIVATDLAGPGHAGNWPTLRDLIVEGACGSTLDCSRSYPMDELLSRPVVIELTEVGDNEKEQPLVTALILQTMTEHYKASRRDGELAHVTVIEGAHRLLGRPVTKGGDAKEGNAQAWAAQAFANTLAENRKYGEGLVIVEQVPEKLIEDAYKNTNLKVMHRLPSEADREVIGGTMRFSPDQMRYAVSLEPFQAFAHHDGLDRPALIRVPNVRAQAAAEAGEARAQLADGSELADRFNRFAEAAPEVDAAFAPFPDCEGCRCRCAFRSRAATTVWPEHGTALKKKVADCPRTSEAQAQRWSRTSEWWRGSPTPSPHRAPTGTQSRTNAPAYSSTWPRRRGNARRCLGCACTAVTPIRAEAEREMIHERSSY